MTDVSLMFLKACRDFLSLAQSHSKRWQKSLLSERDQRIRLEETLEQLAKQHNHLERAFRGATVLQPSFSNPSLSSKGTALVINCLKILLHVTYFCKLAEPFSVNSSIVPVKDGPSGKGDASDEDDDNEFFDAMEDPAEFITVPADPKYHRLFRLFIATLFC